MIKTCSTGNCNHPSHTKLMPTMAAVMHECKPSILVQVQRLVEVQREFRKVEYTPEENILFKLDIEPIGTTITKLGSKCI
jgi:hypothetical protein